MVLFAVLCVLLCAASPVFAESNQLIRFDSFVSVSKETQNYRRERLISEAQFVEMAKESDTIILDTRSKKKYYEKHIAGAIHINFSDFTKKTLAERVPGKKTRILIYCNKIFFWSCQIVLLSRGIVMIP